LRPNNSKTIGILGGGQLGRMMATAAKHMGYRIVVLDPTPDCPTAQVADNHIKAAYDDLTAIRELANISDVVTYEFENVDLEAARLLEEAEKLPQGSRLLEISRDRANEKNLMKDLHLPAAPFTIVNEEKELLTEIKSIGFPAVVKTCRGGYDGKGQLKLTSKDDLQEAAAFVRKNGRCILESWLTFDREISIVLTRGTDGAITYFPVAENEHREHILSRTIVPAAIPEEVAEQARAAAGKLAEAAGVVGTFTVEMFVAGNQLYMNEVAPRPHNSGHYTIEACTVSQFEQHIRAICGLPLLPVHFIGAAVMINLLGEALDQYWQSPDKPLAHLHDYGKQEAKPKRKMGHFTMVGTSREVLLDATDAFTRSLGGNKA
jgi:5-(carboxyamino)imidazole ribonucleotide synthase